MLLLAFEETIFFALSISLNEPFTFVCLNWALFCDNRLKNTKLEGNISVEGDHSSSNCPATEDAQQNLIITEFNSEV